MRILDVESDKKLDTVLLLLTKDELLELIGDAEQLLTKPSADHHHLSSENYQKEITLSIYDPSKIEHFSPRVQKLIREDV